MKYLTSVKIILIVVFLTLITIFFFTTRSGIPGSRYDASELMFFVAELQLFVEKDVDHKLNLLEIEHMIRESKYSNCITVDKTKKITVNCPANHLVGFFEPKISNGQIIWYCQGMPRKSFEGYQEVVGECGQRYRDYYGKSF